MPVDRKHLLPKEQLERKDSNDLRLFVQIAAKLSHNEIYNLFENLINKDLQDELYGYASTTDGETCRESLEALGIKYDVQSLQDY